MSSVEAGPFAGAVRDSAVRSAWMVGVPALYAVLTMLHPASHPTIGDDTTGWIVLHLVQLVLIGGMACVFLALVAEESNTASRVARMLVLPYVIAYSAFDAVAGLGMGAWIEEANSLSAADQAAAERLLDEFVARDALWYLLEFTASLSWLVLALAVVVARWASAPRVGTVLVALGALVFAVGHVRPIGPAGMLLVAAGVAAILVRMPRDSARTTPAGQSP